MAYYKCGKIFATQNSNTSIETASGAIANFNTQLAMPVLGCKAEFSATQAAGTPTPSTPIPIVGVDKVNVTRCGKNLLAKSFDYYSSVGTNLSDYFFVKAGTYRFSFDTSTADNWRFVVRMKDKDGNNLSSSEYQPRSSGVSWSNNAGGWLNTSNLTSKSLTYTFVSDCYIRILFGYGNTSSSTTMTNAQLEIGETATDFEPYNGTTALINLGGTYYGGEVDAVTGKITLTHSDKVNLKNKTWELHPSYPHIFRALITQFDNIYRPTVNQTPNAFCEKLTPQGIGVPTDLNNNCIAIGRTGVNYVFVRDDNANDETEFISNLGDCNFVYELATPIVVYANNTAEIPTINGFNQVYADTGDVEVKYRKLNSDN